MDLFFNPRSIAVAGASQKANLGNHVISNLKNGFTGDIYPINPNYDQIEGLQCFASIESVPGHVDLVIMLVPAIAIPAILKSCAAKGTKRVIIESAGFDESGQEGQALQKECSQIADAAGIRLWGPNCMGLVDVPNNKFFTFMHPRVRSEGMLAGHISLIVQSGMMSAIFLVELAKKGIGIAKACSIGNRSDVNECEILEYLEKDPDTKVIALYLESIPDGRRFTRAVRHSTKPVVLLKGGQSPAGAVAAMSHTSSLAGNSRLSQSVLAGQGVIMADSIFQMADIANALVHIPKMNPACRITIITLSGGAGILACDALERSNLTVVQLSEDTRKKLEQIFPPWMPPANPIDLFPAVAMRGRTVAFMGALNAVMEDKTIDVVIIHVVVGLEDSILNLKQLKQTADQCGKTIVFWLMGIKKEKDQFAQNAREAGITVYSDIIEISRCLEAVSQYNAYKNKAPVSADTLSTDATPNPVPSLSAPKGVMDEYESKSLLSQWGIPVVEEKIIKTAEEAWTFACKASLPVVLKGLCPGMAHKTEHGLVKLGISSREMMDTALSELKNIMKDQGRILIQKQISYEYELIAGYLKDPQFGPCIMFGLGGILAELEPDVAFALAPLSPEDAFTLINGLRNHKLLKGFRGMSALNKTAMAHLLIHLGNLGAACPEIEQMDINPLVVKNGMPTAVDASIIIR
ncbi:MAG: acetate--CoA ligase family protein [Proteobacteria bacterium]|nr:acetate--CoA ligase family protein [Pseudomonadota bacterium]MBU1388457.1 acetate--CoA ligase family protein [Pseudomonadota bacterium]MBU1542719.1 acetate--CoA ligase family protein [Pseudomonadota bacterium]MBU2481253.1 acetate--CoA ligase family protein [Pseudomonadota bacterium]